jgi:hypothetical protein
LPWCETHPKVMPCTADVHDQIAEPRFPRAVGVVDEPTPLDAAVDVCDAHALAGED